MTTPYVGEIRIFSFPRIPTGWFACDGSLKPIAQYQTLYTLLGTQFGGDGITTFGVPDLRGQVPLHQGTGLGLTPRTMGQVGGTEQVTLTTDTTPTHTHTFVVDSTAGNNNTPGSTMLLGAGTGTNNMYAPSATGTVAHPLPASAVTMTGGSQPHDNCMPTLTASICIAWAGVFPTRN